MALPPGFPFPPPADPVPPITPKTTKPATLIPGLKGIWKIVSVFFENMFAAVWVGYREQTAQITEDKKQSVIDFFSDLEAGQWKGLLDYYVSAGIIDQDQANKLVKLKDFAHPFDWISLLLLGVSLWDKHISSEVDAGLAKVQQMQNVKFRSGLPYYSDIIQAAFVEPSKTRDVRNLMAKFGFTEEDMDLVFLSRYRLYPEEKIKEIFLRGEITEAEMVNRMQELGYTPQRIKELISLWEVIPGPQDLFYMVAKEAFEDKMAAILGLDDDFPTEQVQYLKAHGISEFWARKYWRAHWSPPSLQMGFEMFHRDQIEYEDMDALFAAHELPPKWRIGLKNIAYRVLSRVDVRRMHKVGVLDDIGVYDSYRHQGYSPENAQLMTDFTKKYNQGAEKNLTRAQILKGYVNKILDNNTARQLLINLGYSKDESDYYLLLEDYKEVEEYQNDAIDNIKVRLQENLITNQTAQIELEKLNLPSTRISLLLSKWELKRFVAMKHPTKNDLEKMYLTGIIKRDMYRQELEFIGFSTKYSEMLAKLADTKKE